MLSPPSPHQVKRNFQRSKKLGADICINYNTHPEWHRELKKQSGRGADLVIELGGEKSLDKSLRAVHVSGTVALIGVLSGATAPLSLGRVVTQNLRLQGVTLGNRNMFEDYGARNRKAPFETRD